MKTSTPASLLAAITMAPRDPILGITEAYNRSTHPAKINLGVGVYYDDQGKVPLLQCVRQAEADLLQHPKPHTYLPIEGLAAYNNAVRRQLFDGTRAFDEQRVITLQTAGGTGALKVGADFLQRFSRMRRSGSAIPAGKIMRRCSRPPVSRSMPIRITMPPAMI